MIGKTILYYKNIKELGRGGIGVVNLAGDTHLNRRVEIKFLLRKVTTNSESHELFKIEPPTTSALNHPNNTHIYAIEEVDDQICVVMEYVEGIELEEIINTSVNFLSGRESSDSPFERNARKAGNMIPLDNIFFRAT